MIAVVVVDDDAVVVVDGTTHGLSDKTVIFLGFSLF